MISTRRFSAIIRKEFIELFRDRRTMIVMALIPILQLVLFTFAVQNDLHNLPIGWIDSDNSIESREFRNRFVVSENFEVKDFMLLSDAEDALSSSEIYAIAVLPTDFSSSFIRGEQTQIQLLIDGTDPNLARNTTGYFQAMMGDFYLDKIAVNASFKMAPPLDVRLRILYNEDLSTEKYMVPGLLAYILAFLTLVITALAMVKELESGTLEQLFVTPVTRLEVIVGKLLPFGVVAMVIGALIALAGYLTFGIGVGGSVFALIIVAAVFSLSMLAGGLFLSVISQNTLQATQASVSIAIPGLLLSGFMYPIFTMPFIYIIISNALPLTFALIAFRGIYLKGWGIIECLPHIGILTVFVVVYVAITVKLFNRRVA
ncbi:ABC transporter permease [bacterium]|nr:ABC transporter permease [bacterium]